jgi:2'-5' RNA ligase
MNTPQVQQILRDWHVDCKAKFPDIPEKCFLRPEVVHITLLMLPLDSEEKVEKARKVLEAVEPKIKELFASKGLDPAKGLELEFEGLKSFGVEDKTRVVYMKLKETGDAFERVRDLIDLLVKECLEQEVLQKQELSHCNYNKQSARYELEQLHLTIVNASWAGARFFPGQKLLEEFGEGKFVFPPIRCESLQISTRFHYEENGFYLSQKTIPL